MTTLGPWTDDAMWTPDNVDKPTPDVVREHYFVVCAQVMSDGTHRFISTPEVIVNPDEPIYYPNRNEWDRVTADLHDEDTQLQLDLIHKLD